MQEGLNDKVPPHDIEAEQAVLGALLMNWNAMADVVSLLRADRFYSIQNQVIYEAMTKLFANSIQGDTISIINELKTSGNLDKAGGPAYVASLTDLVPSSENIKYYMQIVLDRAARRDLIKISAEIKADSFELSRESDSILDSAEQKIFSLAEKNETTTVHTSKDIMIQEIKIVQSRYDSKNNFTGIPTGFARLDNYTSGFQNSELIILGARPSIGKTALALSMMEYMAVEKQIPVGFFSLEMPVESIGMRLLSQTSRVPMQKIRQGYIKRDEVKKIQEAAARWFNAPFYAVDTPNMRLLDLKAMARRMVRNQKVKIIFIDYIGLISMEEQKMEMWQQVTEISKSLKALARELQIPIVALCQVARDAEGQEPTLAQLRGSGSIEQDADVVMFLHRERLKGPDVAAQDAKIILAKQRNGATGDIKIIYLPAYTKFENKVDDDE